MNSIKVFTAILFLSLLVSEGISSQSIIDEMQRDREEPERNAVTNREWMERCPFPSSDCGIKPDTNGALFEPIWLDSNGSNKPFLQMNSRHASAPFAELITPTILAKEGERICLRLSYLIHGHGIDRLYVSQEAEVSNNPVNAVRIYTARGHQRLGRWRDADMNIILREGKVHYKLNVVISPGKPGRMLIKHWQFHRGTCRSQIGIPRTRRTEIHGHESATLS